MFLKGKEIHKIALSPHRLRKNILDPAMQKEKSVNEILDEMDRDVEHKTFPFSSDKSIVWFFKDFTKGLNVTKKFLKS